MIIEVCVIIIFSEIKIFLYIVIYALIWIYNRGGYQLRAI